MNDWALKVTFCDVANNRFLTLGGAAWGTKRERDANLQRIPAAPAETDFVLDILSPEGIEDDRYIEAITVEILLRKPLDILIRDAGAEEERLRADELQERQS